MIKSSNVRFLCSLLLKSNFKLAFRTFCSRPQFLPVVRVVCMEDDDSVRLSFKISNSPNLSIRAPRNENVSFILSRIKLMAALQRKREEIRRDVKRKYSNSGDIEVEVEEEPVDDVCLLGNNEVIENNTENVHAWSHARILKLGDTEYEVHFNEPVVTIMTLPDYIVPGCFLRPHVLMECAFIEDSVFVWYRSTSPNSEEWVKVGEGYHYMTTVEDSNCYLRVVCSPRRGDIVGPDFICVSKNAVEPGPVVFPFEERQRFAEPVKDADKFRCVSYNTLANMYVERRRYPYASHKARDAYYRKQLLIRELLGYNSDVMCLQEVQGRVFDWDLLPILKKEGYSGLYTKKGGRRFEGLATFFRTSKFRAIFNRGILLNEVIKDRNIYVDLLSKVSGNYKDMSKLLAQETVFQVVLLEAVARGNFKVLIGNTHLYSNKDNPEVRLLQAALCIYYLEHLIKSKALDSMGILFCGDFNSLPNSDAYNFITSGKFQCCPSWKNNNMDSDESEDGILRHNLSLESACGTPEYTNYTEEFKGCLDYIFYSKDYLEVSQVLPFPSHESITAQTGLPSEFYPSDHIALVCTLQQKS